MTRYQHWFILNWCVLFRILFCNLYLVSASSRAGQSNVNLQFSFNSSCSEPALCRALCLPVWQAQERRSQDFDAHRSMEGLFPQFLSLEFSVGILRKIVVKQGRTQSENHLQLSWAALQLFWKVCQQSFHWTHLSELPSEKVKPSNVNLLWWL